MRNERSRFAVGAVTLLLAACAGGWQAVKPAGYKHASAKYSVQFPAGWKQISQPGGTTLIASLYGPQLQSIQIDFRRHKQAFKSQKKDSRPDMDSQELADAVLAELKSLPDLQNVEVIKTAPANIAGHEGFRADLASRRTFQGDGIRFRHVVYGVTGTAGLYVLRYEAPVLHYFERGLPAFESTVASFALLP